LEVVVVVTLLVPAAADVSGVLVGGGRARPAASANEPAVAKVGSQDVRLLDQVGLSARGVVVAVADPALVTVADDVLVVVPAPHSTAVPARESAMPATLSLTAAR
jgi:hypothetical protein